ncbi:MAG: SRPBCC family protein [Azonexus sp.]
MTNALMWLRTFLVLLLPWMSGGIALGGEKDIAILVQKIDDAFIVDASLDVPAKLRNVWDVLTDFDHMPAFLSNLTSSSVVRREGNLLLVRQEGLARFGVFSFQFQSEREVRLEPMRRIFSKSLAGSYKRMESETSLTPTGQSVQVKYHAEIVPDSTLARMFGIPFMRHEVEEQFTFMLDEMKRRERPAGLDQRPAD